MKWIEGVDEKNGVSGEECAEEWEWRSRGVECNGKKRMVLRSIESEPVVEGCRELLEGNVRSACLGRHHALSHYCDCDFGFAPESAHELRPLVRRWQYAPPPPRLRQAHEHPCELPYAPHAHLGAATTLN